MQIISAKKSGVTYFTVTYLLLIISPSETLEFFEKIGLATLFTFIYFCFIGEIFFAVERNTQKYSVWIITIRAFIFASIIALSGHRAIDIYENNAFWGVCLACLALLGIFTGPMTVLWGFQKNEP